MCYAATSPTTLHPGLGHPSSSVLIMHRNSITERSMFCNFVSLLTPTHKACKKLTFDGIILYDDEVHALIEEAWSSACDTEKSIPCVARFSVLELCSASC